MFTKFTIGVLALLALVIASLNPVHAEIGDEGDPALCGQPWAASASAGKGVLAINAPCKAVDPATIKDTSSRFTAFLKAVDQDLWESGRLKQKVLYLYTLQIDSAYAVPIELNLGNWDVAHSPYTSIASSFSYKIPACSRLTLEFYSPWAPQLADTSINVGFQATPPATLEGRDGMNGGGERWATEGLGRIFLPTPVWFQYFTVKFATEPLPPDSTSLSGEKLVCQAAHQ